MAEKEDCVFCKIIEGEISSTKVGESDNFLVIEDANPVSEGHCLIICKKHFENVFELPASLGSEIIDLAKEQGLRLVKEKKADGVKMVQNNGEAAGQTVLHYHVHVIPEKEDVKRKKHV